MTDNASINDKNENYDVIRLDDIDPLFDKDCKHFFEPDDDEIGDFRAWICKKCNRGTFYPKGVNIINS